MIKQATKEDINIINDLLSELNEKINIDYFDFEFNFVFLYEEKGLILYKKIDNFIEIDYIVVKKEYRRQKIGEKLLNKLLEDSNKDLIESIFLEVNVKNECAINFYKKYNFNLASLRKNYYNRKEDALIMERRI